MLRVQMQRSIDDRFPAVLDAARLGDRDAISDLYRRFNPSLVRFLEGRSGTGADLAQDTWIAAFGSLESFDGDERQFRSWLFTIARRRTVDHWRRVSRQPATTHAPVQLAAAVAPDTAGEELIAREAIAELVRHLSPEQADVVLLRVVAGLSVDEVADMIGKSPGAIRVIQHRALRRLAARETGETS
jgi:RNA polymerase sigma-70 factor (ECF subfamily)